MSQVFKAKEEELAAVFGDGYLFTIPVYQRPYSWEVEHVKELIDDLLAAQTHKSGSPYFLGSVVLIKDEGNPRSEVVDGQQRLTTLTIILCVLRELAGEQKQRDEIHDFVRQKGNSKRGTSDEYRLTLRELDREFFARQIQEQGNLDALLNRELSSEQGTQRRLTENLRQIHETLQKLSKEDQEKLVDFIVQKCVLVIVTATDRDSAFRVFSVMNDRGLDLSPTDILKADTIGEMEAERRQQYAEKWERIEERLGREHFRDLFAHLRMIRLKSKLRRTLQEDFQEHILKQTSGADFVDLELEPYSDVYERVRDASYESTRNADTVNRYLDYLGRLDNFDWIPPVMAFVRAHEADQDSILQFVRDMERLAYGLFILRADVNRRINRYAEVLKGIEANRDLFTEDSPLQLESEEKKEILARLDGEVYNWVPVARRVLLERLNSQLAEPKLIEKYSRVTIEHVLPQNPEDGSEWMRWFPEEEERQGWTHRLANLVLLSRKKNAQASNWEFGRKKDEYFSRNGVSSFSLTTQVIREDEWTVDTLRRRQLALLDVLGKEWRLR